MTERKYQELKDKRRNIEDCAGVEKYESLASSANTVNTFAAILMVLMNIGSIGLYAVFSIPLMSMVWMFLCGCLIGVAGEAVSRTMDALAAHMKDGYVTRQCMEKLVSRLGKPKAQGSAQNSAQAESK